MSKILQTRSRKTGLPPGTMVHIGSRKTEAVSLSFFHYTEKEVCEKTATTLEELTPFVHKPGILWVNIEGVHDVEKIRRIAELFGIHPLVMEDIVNTDQRPKIEDFGHFMYVVARMLTTHPRTDELVSEQVSFVLGPTWVLSFQEGKEGDVFDPVRLGLRQGTETGRGSLRRLGADYLLYSLLDVVVDRYFGVLEKMGERIELLEARIIDDPKTQTVRDIHHSKREMIFLRKSVWPLRDVLSVVYRAESKLVSDATRMYFRDIYDHIVQVMDVIETCRDMLSSMLDIYLSAQANRQNEVMKTLTIIATLFMPLTFLVGVYGMNFDVMPELHWKWGYAGVWGVMLASTLGMLVYFKRKRWF